MNYSWRKENTRPPKCLRQGLAEVRIIFKEFISKFKQEKICYCIHWWMKFLILLHFLDIHGKKGFPAEKNLFRKTTDRKNAIAAQWEKNDYFMVKSVTSNKESISNFIKKLLYQLKLTMSKSQLELRTVII